MITRFCIRCSVYVHHMCCGKNVSLLPVVQERWRRIGNQVAQVCVFIVESLIETKSNVETRLTFFAKFQLTVFKGGQTRSSFATQSWRATLAVQPLHVMVRHCVGCVAGLRSRVACNSCAAKLLRVCPPL